MGNCKLISRRGDREIAQHHRGVEYPIIAVSNADYIVIHSDYCIICIHFLKPAEQLQYQQHKEMLKILIIKERDGYVEYNITIDPESSVTIDGSATYTPVENKGSVTLISDGSNWFVIEQRLVEIY